MKKCLLIVGVLISLITSCSKSITLLSDEYVSEESNVPNGIIPLADALETLADFLSDTSKPLSMTKGDGGRIIVNTGAYFSSGKPTKGTESLPDAYVVNFEAGQGFAVLGAHSGVAPVIAVTENGNIDPETLTIESQGYPADTTLFSTKGFVEDIIRIGATPSNPDGGGGVMPPTLPDDPDEPPVGPPIPYVHYSATINTTWDQGSWNEADLYNNYCYEDFAIGGFTYVFTGCSTTAMAGIVEYNRFPTTLTVNGKSLNYSAMDAYPIAYYLSSDSAKDDVGRLMGAIYHNVAHLSVTSFGTCITPAQIENCMTLFGYSNVVRLQGSSFTSEMVAATKIMLQNNKPVFVSAIPSSDITSAHSWVVDEIKGRALMTVYCNWGWSGYYDGFFSTTCFNPNGTTYNFHFRVITYDIPSGQTNVNITF